MMSHGKPAACVGCSRSKRPQNEPTARLHGPQNAASVKRPLFFIMQKMENRAVMPHGKRFRWRIETKDISLMPSCFRSPFSKAFPSLREGRCRQISYRYTRKAILQQVIDKG